MDERTQLTPVDLERLVELDLVRTTEAVALHAFHWLGRGEAGAAHAAAVDAMRGALDITCISGTVVYGETLKPKPNGIQPGEKLGNGYEGSLPIDLAAIPIDGLNMVAQGLPGSLSLLVAARSADDQPALTHITCRYMEKISYGRTVKSGPGQVHLNASVRDNLEIIALKLGKRVQDLSVTVLDRPRHERLIRDIRKAGASVRLIADGDVAACIAPSLPHSGVDAYMGTGGVAETVISAAAIRCLCGDILSRMTPVDEQEKKHIIDTVGEKTCRQHFCAEDLVRGDNVVFCATAISDSPVLRGVVVEGDRAQTCSVMMRTRYNTVRYINSTHDLSRKTVRLRSAQAETSL